MFLVANLLRHPPWGLVGQMAASLIEFMIHGKFSKLTCHGIFFVKFISHKNVVSIVSGHDDPCLLLYLVFPANLA